MSIPFITANRHFGDTVGVFLDSGYMGLSATFPFTVAWADSDAEIYTLIIETRNVETFQNLKGHPVLINGQEVGRIKDASTTPHQTEVTTIQIQATSLPGAFTTGSQNTLTIEVETDGLPKGLADDFLLLSVSSDNFSAKLGW